VSLEVSERWALVLGLALLAVDLTLSIALEAIAGLTRPALRRMARDAAPRLAFLETVARAASPHRAAALLLRSLCLLGVALSLAVAASTLGAAASTALGVGAAAVGGAIVGEAVLARAVAARDPRRALRRTAWILRIAHVVALPIVAPVGRVADRLRARAPVPTDGADGGQDEEVEALIEVGERTGILEAAEGEMMRGIVDLDATRVREIMTPRTDIVALPADTSVQAARRRLLEVGHTRLPVFQGSIDNVVGVLHGRDLFHAWEQHEEERAIAGYLRPAVFVPETLSAAELLTEMRQRTHLAVVVDEYGGVAGLVTLEDVLEEIVGDIRDEHDAEETLVRADADGSWVVDAVAHVEELEELFGVEFGEREFDTVGGLVVSSFGRVPAVGETTSVAGLSVEVLEADGRRVQSVRIRRSGAAVESTGPS
jgi:magnesium and cobalt transporter